jgi:hypothetical protein
MPVPLSGWRRVAQAKDLHELIDLQTRNVESLPSRCRSLGA